MNKVGKNFFFFSSQEEALRYSACVWNGARVPVNLRMLYFYNIERKRGKKEKDWISHRRREKTAPGSSRIWRARAVKPSCCASFLIFFFFSNTSNGTALESSGTSRCTISSSRFGFASFYITIFQTRTHRFAKLHRDGDYLRARTAHLRTKNFYSSWPIVTGSHAKSIERRRWCRVTVKSV